MNHLEKKVMYLVWAWAILGSSTAFAKDIPSLGRDCQNGDQRACAEITRIVVATKRPKDRIAAIPFISDTSVLTSISNDSTQDRDVSRAAADRLSVLNKQARDRKEACLLYTSDPGSRTGCGENQPGGRSQNQPRRGGIGGSAGANCAQFRCCRVPAGCANDGPDGRFAACGAHAAGAGTGAFSAGSGISGPGFAAGGRTALPLSLIHI